MSIYTRKEKEVPFNVVEVDNTNFDEEEKCWTIDAFGSGEEEGTVAAVVYCNGAVKELYKDAMMLPVVVEAIFDVLSHEIFKNKKQ